MRLHGPLLAISLAVGSLNAVAATADVAHGEDVYNRCMACHALKADRVGPHHCGLIGRRVRFSWVTRYDRDRAFRLYHTAGNDLADRCNITGLKFG